MQSMIVENPPEVETAHSAFVELQKLQIGQRVRFEPALTQPTVDILYRLMLGVDKEWVILAGKKPKMSFWKALKASMNTPVDFGGREIPQTIVEIARVR